VSPGFAAYPIDSGRLKGNIALITGGGRGIGEAIATRFSAEGATVVLASRTQSEIEQVAARLRASGAKADAFAANVTDPAQVASLVERALRHGRIDILVNAAGIYGPIGPMWEQDPEAWKAALDINTYGTFLMCRAVVPHMIRRGSGAIVNFSGGGATAPLPRFSAYAVSKAAVVRLTETLAEEVREHGIRVNVIAPGAIDTTLQDAVLAAGERAGRLLEMIQRIRKTGEGGTPIEVPAALASFLACGDSAPLTGKLVSAPHDGWQKWDRERIADVSAKPWFTLRRLDPFTVKPLVDEVQPKTQAADTKK
jgi:3-oxoacyl-[acyl-carrier protein] reductase